jgi:endogenous inhibitor of DNA gyrase (YacG/DUF329 family)
MRRCAGCGSDFEPPANNKAKRFCTQRCWITYFNRTDRDHSVAGAQKGAASNQSKWASFKSNKSYKKRDGEHLHRQVAAETLGRALKPEEIVHHIDGNKWNNAPDNLEVLPSQAEHARRHLSGGRFS